MPAAAAVIKALIPANEAASMFYNGAAAETEPALTGWFLLMYRSAVASEWTLRITRPWTCTQEPSAVFSRCRTIS
jgi:hypothetical protein